MDALAPNLRRLRKQGKFTQAQLADLAGLPRATLATMEQEGANPGIHAVLAVAKALGVSLDELLVLPPEHRHYHVAPAEMQEYRAEAGRYVARLVSPITSKGVQIHHVTMQPGCVSVGRPHPIGAQEFYYGLTGTSLLIIEDESVEVRTGHLVQFPGHRRHVYRNPDQRTVATAISTVVFRMG
ncbi:MAG: helix-turn-helix transcriptional regulator [Planctomycetes bacterium]|nr:helix-turn-helix transcriptional regulator [Planctomycetota bacterium]